MNIQSESVIVIWQAAWHELDQPIKLGLKDTFWLTSQNGFLKFYTGLSGDREVEEMEGEILRIVHNSLGEISEIDTKGLSYRIRLMSGPEIVVEAEETPGKIENDFPAFDTGNWQFEVTIRPTNQRGHKNHRAL